MITDIRLQNFRSYVDAAFEFDQGVNIIVGPNASGKTNLLEAILVLSIGKSYRASDEELTKIGEPWARLECHGDTGVRVLKLTAEPAGKTFEIDQKVYKRLAADKQLPVVLFEPLHLLILTGRPELRRDYLDDLLEQMEPAFAKTRRDYKRTLAQRNALLKQPSAKTVNQLFAWNVRLSELAGAMVAARRRLIVELNNNFGSIYKQLSASQTEVELIYLSKQRQQNYESNLLKQLESHTELDYLRGFTAFGPHRDDMQVTIKDQPAQNIASRGEIRSLVLALKIMEIKLLETASDRQPIILLDDVFSELDGARRQALTKYLKDYQTFITTTDADLIIHDFAQKSNVISLA